jgi:hypothetical protein
MRMSEQAHRLLQLDSKALALCKSVLRTRKPLLSGPKSVASKATMVPLTIPSPLHDVLHVDSSCAPMLLEVSKYVCQHCCCVRTYARAISANELLIGQVSEVFDFTQEDLQTAHCAIVDGVNELYVWFGKSATDLEKQMAMETAIVCSDSVTPTTSMCRVTET